MTVSVKACEWKIIYFIFFLRSVHFMLLSLPTKITKFNVVWTWSFILFVRKIPKVLLSVYQLWYRFILVQLRLIINQVGSSLYFMWFVYVIVYFIIRSLRMKWNYCVFYIKKGWQKGFLWYFHQINRNMVMSWITSN